MRIVSQFEVNTFVYDPPILEPGVIGKKGCAIIPTQGYCTIQVHDIPFAEGAERMCYHGIQRSHGGQNDLRPPKPNLVVLKALKDACK